MSEPAVDYVLDADVVIYALNGDQGMLRWLAEREGKGVAVSAIALAQVEAGLARHGRGAVQLAALLTTLSVLPFQADHARAYGALVRTIGFKRRQALDHMIAAQAIAAGAALVTNNAADFDGVPGLRLERWA